MHKLFGTCALLCAISAGCSDDFHSAGFLERVDTPLANNRSAVALGVGDLDGDQRHDVVVANAQNELNVLISKGDGSFATGIAYPLDAGASSRIVALADLSGDGRADVLVGNDTLGTLSLFWNQGAGTLQAASGAIAANCRPRALALADAKPNSDAVHTAPAIAYAAYRSDAVVSAGTRVVRQYR